MKERIPVLLTEQPDEQAFKRWFLHHAPDAIVTKHIQVLDWLKALGAQPPHVGFVHVSARRHGKGLGFMAADAAWAARYRKLGFNMIAAGLDSSLLQTAIRATLAPLGETR